MKKAVIITARTQSNRFPGKILKRISGKKRSIDILIERSKKIGHPIILATSTSKEDDKLCKHVKKYHDIKIFRGNKKNKIRRWQLCFKKYNIKIASMIDGDDLCFDYNLYKNNMFTKSILCCPGNIITGIFTNVLSSGTINKLSKNLKRDIDTEMIEPLIKKKNIKKKIIKINKIYLNKKIRLTFDYKEDYILLKKIFKKFSASEKTENIVRYLLKNKKLNEINYFRERDWKKNQKLKTKSTYLNL